MWGGKLWRTVLQIVSLRGNIRAVLTTAFHHETCEMVSKPILQFIYPALISSILMNLLKPTGLGQLHLSVIDMIAITSNFPIIIMITITSKVKLIDYYYNYITM